MNITVELQSLQSALDIVMRIAPPAAGNINFKSKKGELTVTSVAELGHCTALIACKVSKDGEFAVPAQALRDAIKGRSNLELSYGSDTLTIKSGSYKTALSAVDVIPAEEIDKSDSKKWKVTAEVADWIADAIKRVALKPTTIISSWMPVGVKIGKSAFICCYDETHMNWVSSKEVSGDFEAVLPLDTMSTVMDVFKKGAFSLECSDSYVRARNKMVDAYMSVPDMKDIIPIQQIQAKIKEASTISSKSIKFPKADLLTFMDNARAVISKERAELLVRAADNAVNLEIRTGQGQSKVKMKGSGKGEFAIDYEFLQELVLKAPEEVVLNVVDGAYVSMKLAASSAIVALNQTPTKSKGE